MVEVLSHPLKSKIQELLVSADIEKTAIYNRMLDYTIDIFETQGLGRDYYGYHNIDHELEVTYIALLAATWEKKIQRFSQSDIEYLYTAALFHDFDPQKSVDRPHEESVIQFISLDRELKKLILREKPDVALVQNVFPLISPSAYDILFKLEVPIVQSIRNFRLFYINGTFFDGKIRWP